MSGPRDLHHTFAGAGEVQHQIAGRFVRILAATGDVFLKLDGGSELQRASGHVVDEPNGFTRIAIRSAIAQAVQLVISETPQDDNTQTVTATVSATVAAGNTLTTTADASVLATITSQVLAGRADRLTVIIKNLNSNTDAIRVGDASTGAAQGHELMPGESISLDSTSAIYVYNSKASAQSVSIIEVRGV